MTQLQLGLIERRMVESGNNKFPDKLNEYYPRFNLNQTRHELKEFSLERLIPSFQWVPIGALVIKQGSDP